MQPTIDSASLKIQEGFQELLGISQKEALSMSMGIFVGIIETTLRLQGEDPSKTIDIEGEGEGNRSITIHPVGYVKPEADVSDTDVGEMAEPPKMSRTLSINERIYAKAVAMTFNHDYLDPQRLQDKLDIVYHHACAILSRMEIAGYLEAPDGDENRKVIMTTCDTNH